jgi:hypothetical protein
MGDGRKRLSGAEYRKKAKFKKKNEQQLALQKVQVCYVRPLCSSFIKFGGNLGR